MYAQLQHVLLQRRRFVHALGVRTQVKAVPGRKTDVKDSVWIAKLLMHGLLSPSFVPDVALLELSDLTR